MTDIPITDKVPSWSYKYIPSLVWSNILTQKESCSLKGVGLAINRFLRMIKNIGIIWNASYAYRKYTHNHTAKKYWKCKQWFKFFYNKSKFIKSSKSSNTAAIITKLQNSQMKIKKAFTTLNTRIEDIEHEDSGLTNSYEDDKEKLHFRFD